MGNYLNQDGKKFYEITHSDIYVDKTELLTYTNSVLQTLQKYICISRPRRFGKSITASMIAAYYSRGCDAKELFSPYKIARNLDFDTYRNKYNTLFLNMQEFLSATSGIDEMLRMLNDYLIFDLREQYSQVRFRDEKNLIQVMKDLTYDNEKENVSIPNREVSQEYINAISRFPFCNTTMKTRCGRIFLSLFSVPACSV